ncbi:FtsK/SpoIIIE domain-containing protein [Streptomyces sp. NBC_01304]|uniref:FtsK/SpoIIIE domain-containing protein n=1 Tax=Streptomyces sp. NBC_01304 TaxID=2903818 RepID=UPI002E10AD07|nr:FtsK/SpoIIIE domain-containing protein [Streptomyces sp. NBC_01304]
MAQPSTTVEKREQSAAAAACFYGVGVAIIAVAASRLLNVPQLLPYGLAAAAVIAVLWGIIATLVQRRTRPVRHLHAALLPSFGPEFTKDRIKVRKFQRGLPTEITIEYPAIFNERDEKKRAEVRDILAIRLGGKADATWDPVRRRVVATIAPTAGASLIHDGDTGALVAEDGDNLERVATREHATGVIKQVLGTASKVAVTFDDNDIPNAIEVVYPTTRHDVSPRFRQAILTQVDEKIDISAGAWRDMWDVKNSSVKFVPRPHFPKNAPYPLDVPSRYGVLPYAVNEDNELVEWVLGSKSPHHLVVGPTGSGKTVLIRDIAISAAMQGIPVILCDPKRIEYRALAGFPGIIVVTRIEDISYALLKTSALMHERYDLIEAGIVDEGSFTKVLCIVDEFIIYKELVNAAWRAEKDEDNKPQRGDDPSIKAMNNMGYLARSADVHLVIGMQRPDADILGGPLRDQLRKRTALDQHTPETAKMMWGNARTGTDLPSVQGRGMSETGFGPAEIQVLRMLPPGTKGHSAEDALMWAEVERRASDPKVWENVEIPDFFPELEQRRRDAIQEIKARYGQGEQPALSLNKPALEAPADDESEEVTAAPAHEPQSRLEQVSPEALEVGDQIMIEDETGIPEIVEVTGIEYASEDGEEIIEVEYVSTETGTNGMLQLGPDSDVDRCG